MYDLGEYFKLDYAKAVANPECVVKGLKYRITVLTESLFRLEYSEEGRFNDKPTELVWYRNFKKPEFEIKQDNHYLQITTKYAKLVYSKDRKFYGGMVNPACNLSIQLNNSERFWYYKHPEARNIGGPGYQIDSNKLEKVKKLSDLKFNKGLFSFDGFVSIDDSKSKVVSETGILTTTYNEHIDIYLFAYGNDYEQCLKDYFKITGYPTLLPRYALGNWWNKNDDYNDETLKEIVSSFLANRVPISVITLNKSWHKLPELKKGKSNSGFTFNRDNFEEPKAMVDFLHKYGIRVGLNINPFDGFYPIDQPYEQIASYLNKNDNGSIPFNVLEPKVLDAYLKLYIHPLDNYGIDFYWLDYYDSKKNEEIAYLKHYQLYDMTRNYKRRPMVLGPNTGLAPHRYPVLNAPSTVVGWNNLKLLALYNSSISNIGVSWWSHDIGGFTKGIEDNELYTRFIELGVFSPILKLSSDKGKYYKREPWKWSMETYNISKEFLCLRHKLIPYIYSEAYKFSKYGTPFLKPVYYTNPELYDDELYYTEYYYGSELFISPIIDRKDPLMNRTIHKFFVPDGIWYDFFTGKKFPGPSNYVSFFREQDYPVFAKSGSIIVMGVNKNPNDTNPPENMEIHIFPGKSNTYHLYEDDGISDLYKKGFFLLTDIDYNYMPNNYTVIIRAVDGKSDIVPPKRNYKIIFRNTKKAEDVSVHCDDLTMNYISYVSGSDFIVEVKDAKTLNQITVNCKGKDIEIDAVRIINKDIEQILSDLKISTELKERVDSVIFSDLPINKKRIQIRHLKKYGLRSDFIKLFLKLLEYIKKV